MPQDLGTYGRKGRTDGRVQLYMPPTLWGHKKISLFVSNFNTSSDLKMVCLFRVLTPGSTAF